MDNKRQFYKNNDSGLIFLICIVAPFLLSFVFSMIAKQIASSSGKELEMITSSLAYVLIYSLCNCALYILMFFLYNKINKISFSASKIKFNMPWHTYLILIAVGIISLLGVNYFVGATDNVLEVIGFPIQKGLPLVNPTSFPLFLLSLLVMAVIPAICEELIFRGVVLHGLRNKFGEWGAIFLSGLMFALFHGNLQQFIYPFILGSIMGWLVLRTGSLVSSMIVHFVNNGLVVTFAYIENMTGFSLNLPNTWWFYLIAFALLGLTFVILLLINMFYFKNKSAEKIERTPEKISPSLIVSFVVSGFLLVLATIIQFVSNNVA